MLYKTIIKIIFTYKCLKLKCVFKEMQRVIHVQIPRDMSPIMLYWLDAMFKTISHVNDCVLIIHIRPQKKMESSISRTRENGAPLKSVNYA